jgi:hypothetical protein
VRLTTSLLVGAKYFGCVGCRFHVAIGAELRLDRHHKQIVWSIAKPASINLRKWFLSPTGSIKPWFHTKGNLPLCSSYLSLGVPNWVAKHRQSSIFLAPFPGIEEEDEAPTSTTRHQSIFLALLPGRKRISARGVSRLQSFTLLLFCLFSLLYFCLHLFIKNTKKLVPL